MVADNGGKQRQQTMMAREIRWGTTTGKVESGQQTLTALSVRDGEEDVAFDRVGSYGTIFFENVR
jgi:hypothetical protein